MIQQYWPQMLNVAVRSENPAIWSIQVRFTVPCIHDRPGSFTVMSRRRMILPCMITRRRRLSIMLAHHLTPRKERDQQTLQWVGHGHQHFLRAAHQPYCLPLKGSYKPVTGPSQSPYLSTAHATFTPMLLTASSHFYQDLPSSPCARCPIRRKNGRTSITLTSSPPYTSPAHYPDTQPDSPARR